MGFLSTGQTTGKTASTPEELPSRGATSTDFRTNRARPCYPEAASFTVQTPPPFLPLTHQVPTGTSVQAFMAPPPTPTPTHTCFPALSSLMGKVVG